MEQYEELVKCLNDRAASRCFVEIEREPFGDTNLYGLILSANRDYTLIMSITAQLFLDGFILIRTNDIVGCQVEELRAGLIGFVLKSRYGEDYFEQKTTSILKVAKLVDLKLVEQSFPLLTVYTELIDEDAIFVGSLIKMGSTSMHLRLMTPDAEWEATKKFALKDITRIDFGGGYEEGLWLYSQIGKKLDLLGN